MDKPANPSSVDATPEQVARRIAEKVARRLHVSNDQRMCDDFASVALAAIIETTEAAARLADDSDGYDDATGSLVAIALRNNDHLKAPHP